VRTIQRLGFARLFPSLEHRTRHSTEPAECCACGCIYHLELFPERHDTDDDVARDVSPYSCATHSSRSHGQILRCLRCGLVFMRPRLTADALVDEYAHAIDPVYLEHIKARETTFRYNLSNVRHHIKDGDRILEIGSYCGAFLKVAREAGLDIVGVEPSAWAVNASAQITDAKVYCGTIDDLPERHRAFDVVIAWDVLEHFADPVRELRKINELLPNDGTFLFSTLMIDNWFPRAMGKHWPWFMDMHLFYFTESTIRNVLRDTGFELVDETKYCHVVTLEYLLSKLGTLGIPLSSGLSDLIGQAEVGRAEIPFRFGDVKLFVCRKVAQVKGRSTLRESTSSDSPTDEHPRNAAAAG
jgi:SAM-dependent methyltransferase